MRKKKLPRVSFFSALILIMVFLTSAVFLINCNNSTSDNKVPEPAKDWVVLNIKFKSNTTTKIRDVAVKSIENFLNDTVSAMRNNGYPHYLPDIVISTSPFRDTLKYQFRVRYVNMPLKDTTLDPPPCYCKNNCGICSAVIQLFAFPPSPSQLTEYLDSAYTEQ